MKLSLREAVLKEVGADNDPSVWRMPGGSGGTEQVMPLEEEDDEQEEIPLIEKIVIEKLNAIICRELNLSNFDFEFQIQQDEFISNDFAWSQTIGLAAQLLNNLFVKVEIEEKNGIIFLSGEIIGHNGNEALTKTLFRNLKYETSPIKETIEKVKGGYEVVSHKGKNLGKSKSRKQAIKRLKQVEFFKNRGK